MPITQDDFDRNPDLTTAAIQHASALMCQQLRRLAEASTRHPDLTPQQALHDAADMFEAAIQNYLIRLSGGNTLRH